MKTVTQEMRIIKKGEFQVIQEEPADVMFKKVMEVSDEWILPCLELAAGEVPGQIEEYQKALGKGMDPRDIKLILAEKITSLYHGEEEAGKAVQHFRAVFCKPENPGDIPEIIIDWERDTLKGILPLLVEAGLASSISELCRVFIHGKIQCNGEPIAELEQVLSNGDILRIGKKKFVRIVK